MLELYIFDEGVSEEETVMFDVYNLKYYLVAKNVLDKCSTFSAIPDLHSLCKFYVPENAATEISSLCFPIKLKKGNEIIFDGVGEKFKATVGWSYGADGEVYVSKNLEPIGYKRKLGEMLFVPYNYKILMQKLNEDDVECEDTKDYRIVSRETTDELEVVVNEFITSGYEPMGSAFYDGERFYQTIVKKKGVKNEF